MPDLKEIADKADLIVNGYAFTKESDGRYRVLNLNSPKDAAVITADGTVIETTMDDIGVEIVKRIFRTDREFLEEEDA